MKKGVYVINTARGELIDPDALLEGLNEGIIAGFGSDVLEEHKEQFIDLPNVVLTPHIAFFSTEAVKNIIRTTAENINNFLTGNPTNLIK